MARYLTAGVVVLADDHPHAQGTIDAARAYAGHRYAVGRGEESRFGGFDDVVDPGRAQATVSSTFKEAAKRRIPWVALRRDLAPPAELLAQLLEATARHTSKELPGFVALLTGAGQPLIRRILAVVDRSDGQPSGLMILAAVAAAEATGAAVDVLVIGAPDEELDSSIDQDRVLRVARDRDLYDQAKRRSENLGVRGNWMFIDNVDSRVKLVRDVLAAQEYDLVVDDLGDINLGGRLGRSKRIDKALRKDGPAAITMAVLKKSDLPVLLVLDAVRLGLVPAKMKAGAGVGVLAMGIMVSAAPQAAASPGERDQIQTSISQTVDTYDVALTAAANLAAPETVAAAQSAAQQTGDQAEAAITGQEVESTSTVEDLAADPATQDQTAQETSSEEDAAAETDSEATADEQTAQQTDQQTADQQTADQQTADQQTGDQQTADENGAETESTDDAAGEVDPAAVSPAELAPDNVEPEKAEQVDPDDVDVPDDLERSDVDKAEKAANESKEALDDAQQEFDDAQAAAVEAKSDAVDASAASVDASSTLDQANDAYEEATSEATSVIADATGVSGAIPGGASAEDMAAAEAEEAEALADLEAAGQQANEALGDYQEAAAEATEAAVELDAAAAQVTEAQTEYNEDEAKADAYSDAYQDEMADARVSPVAEGEYTSTGHYGQSGGMWSTGSHTGEDYAAPVGTEVVAAGSGTVVEVEYGDGAYGNRIVIEHENGYYTTYNHLSSIDVEVGDEVTAGDKIGEVGNTGNSTGAHLHFEVTKGGDGWSGGSFVDPDAWLAGEVG